MTSLLPVLAPPIAVTVDGRAVRVPRGAMLLEAITAAGADLPHLCKPEASGPLGACRTCLVEVEGGARLVAACHTPVAEGAAIHTTSEKAQRIRRGVLDLTIGMSVDGAGKGHAAEEARKHGLDVSSYASRPRTPRDESNLFFTLNMADCILCGRCVDACQRTQHIGAIGINGRGETAHIGVAFDAPWEESTCTSCGQCVSQCPTGALLPKQGEPARASGRATAVATTVTRTTCPYCGVGCGLDVHTVDGRLDWVDGVAENGSSQGMTCVKGRFGLEFVHSQDRLTHPLIRRNGALERATWDEALDLVAQRFAASLGAFAGIASAKATNEDGYVMQKFVRAVMGTNSIDHCSRMCHAPSVVALMEQVGSGATSNSYEDYDHAGTLLVVGSDTAQNHPVVASRLRRAVKDRGAVLIVVNPIRIDLCDLAEIHLQPRPGTDVAVFNAMAQVILDEDLWNRGFVEARTEGFEAWRRVAAQVTPEDAERISGVPAEDIRRAARLYARPRPGRDGEARGSCLIWGMGVTQHTNGSDNARSLINLALLCGQVGGFGNGISPLRGQNNVQGCSDSGCLPNGLPGYEPLDGPAHERFLRAWDADLPTAAGLQSTAMIDAMIEGRLKALYVVGENPLISDPYLAHTREAFEHLDFLVVQDIFMHETAELADVVLPAASFAEKYGTFTNSERRVQLVRPMVPPPGEARDDWAITAEIARRVLRIRERPVRAFEYDGATQIFDEMASLMPIIAGLSHERLEREGGLQWPVPDATHPGTPRLFETEFPRGRGKFVAVEQGPPAAELPSTRFPFTLITGRSLYHWHTGVITRRVPGLVGHVPVVAVDMHPADADRLGLREGDAVQLASRRGEIVAEVHAVDRMRRGELFVPFVQLQGMAANFLTNDALDLPSGIPEFKACAVRVEKPGTPSRAGREPRGQRKGRAPEGPAGGGRTRSGRAPATSGPEAEGEATTAGAPGPAGAAKPASRRWHRMAAIEVDEFRSLFLERRALERDPAAGRERAEAMRAAMARLAPAVQRHLEAFGDDYSLVRVDERGPGDEPRQRVLSVTYVLAFGAPADYAPHADELIERLAGAASRFRAGEGAQERSPHRRRGRFQRRAQRLARWATARAEPLAGWFAGVTARFRADEAGDERRGRRRRRRHPQHGIRRFALWATLGLVGLLLYAAGLLAFGAWAPVGSDNPPSPPGASILAPDV